LEPGRTAKLLDRNHRDIFSVKDDAGGDGYLVDQILDVAGAKGRANG
jgi:6-phosphogluconate dehydrogenase